MSYYFVPNNSNIANSTIYSIEYNVPFVVYDQYLLKYVYVVYVYICYN